MEGSALKLTLLLLLISHVLGDYYFQTQSMADRKEQDKKELLRHCLVYGLPFLILALVFGFDPGLAAASLLAILIHALIDFGKASILYRMSGKKKNRSAGYSGKVYLLDQSIHWLSLFLIAFFLRRGFAGLAPVSIVQEMFAELDFAWGRALQWLLAILLIYRPSNITFVKLFSIYKPEEEPELSPSGPTHSFREGEKLKAGGIIGVLEKMISLIFLTVGEFMAIGLILTAKSIARYDKISKNPTFAEYYLIGTLTSLIMVLLIYFLCFVIFSGF